MKPTTLFGVGSLLFTSLAVAACSGGSAPRGIQPSAGSPSLGEAGESGASANSAAGGGAGGASVDTAAEAGAAEAGAAGAAEAGAGGTNDETVFGSEAGAWLLYTADEDTPGLEELYAVKEGLIGTQPSIKIALPLIAQYQEMVGQWFWSSNAEDLLVITRSTVGSRVFAIHFGNGLPEKPLELTAKIPPAGVYTTEWRANGDAAVFSSAGLYLFSNEHGKLGSAARVTPAGQTIGDAEFVLGGAAVVYASGGNEYFVSLAGTTPSTPVAFTGVNNAEAAYVSADGNWLIIMTYANGVGGQFVAPAKAGAAAVPLNRPLVGNSEVAFRFSPDSRHIAYAASETLAGYSEVYLLDLPDTSKRTLVASELLLSPSEALSTFTPDSTGLFFFDDGGRVSTTKAVHFFDLARGTVNLGFYEIGTRDSLLGFAHAHGWALLSTQRTSAEPYTLSAEAFGPNGEGSLELATAPKGLAYSEVELAADDSAALLVTSPPDATDHSEDDLYYLDLRNPIVGLNPPVRLPGEGEGVAANQPFSPDKKGFAYYRYAPDGSRTLYWVDASKSVLGAPVAITRGGRARMYGWQP